MLTSKVKLTNWGAASPRKDNGQEIVLSKEDRRSAELAAKAQRGDYDDGTLPKVDAKCNANNDTQT